MPEYYPPVGFHFRVDFGLPGVSSESNDVRFQEVSGLSTALNMEPLFEGGENRFAHQLPNPPTYDPLVLKRGMLTDSTLIGWVSAAIEHFVFLPINLSVVLLNGAHEPLASWEVMNAKPKKWAVDPFNASDGKVLVETFELTYDYFRRTS